MRDRVPSPLPGRAIAAFVIAVGMVALGLTVLPTGTTAATSPSAPTVPGGVSSASPSWNNGRVTLSFVNDHPSFVVTSVSNRSAWVNQTLTGLAEVNVSDGILSFASFTAPGVVWNLSARSTSNATDVVLVAAVPVLASGGEWESGDDSGGGNRTIGMANVSITFGLNASNSVNPWSVSYSLNVRDWPWLHAADSVGVEVRATATSPSAYWAADGTNRLTELTRASHRPLASFVWGATAKALYSGGSSEDSSVGSYSNLTAGGSSFLVRLEFGSVTGGYTSLSYDPWLAIIPTSGPLGKLAAWILTPTSLAIIAGGGIAVLALAVLARARRSPPESGL